MKKLIYLILFVVVSLLLFVVVSSFCIFTGKRRISSFDDVRMSVILGMPISWVVNNVGAPANIVPTSNGKLYIFRIRDEKECVHAEDLRGFYVETVGGRVVSVCGVFNGKQKFFVSRAFCENLVKTRESKKKISDSIGSPAEISYMFADGKYLEKWTFRWAGTKPPECPSPPTEIVFNFSLPGSLMSVEYEIVNAKGYSEGWIIK